MSDFVDRLEQELLASGRRSRSGRAARRARRGAVSGAPAALSIGAVAMIVALIIVAAVNHRSSSTGVRGDQPRPPGSTFGATGVTAAACRAKTVGRRLVLPPLAESEATPSNALVSILGSLRRPATAADQIDLRKFNRSPYEAITIYKRYIRVHTGEHGARIAILPAIICSLPRSFGSTYDTRPKPTLVLLMQVLSNPGPLPTVLVGSAPDVEAAQANPGLDNTSPKGWLQAAVVPDGVARVVMQFTPPFLHHYTITMAIHDNVGIAIRRPDYSPTSVRWYSADGHLIRTYIDRQALNYDNCLAQHKRTC